MNIILVSMLIAAIAFPLVLKAVKKDIEWKMIGILSAVFVALSLIAFYSGKAGKTLDVEIWSGEVTSKTQDRVSCSHSYSCNCKSTTSCTGSGSSRSCTTSTSCDTCYEHSFDYDWVVHSNIGKLDIDRVDRQGLQTPARWSAVKIGEPFSKKNLHTNYIKGVPDSIFNHAQSLAVSSNLHKLVPAYPSNVYDYYRIDRVISVGVPVPDLPDWNRDVSNLLKQLGPQKQANVIILFVNTNDPQFEYALRSAWLGGKKNDIIVMLGVTEYPKIAWARVMSWTDKEIFKIELRDSLQELEVIDRPTIINMIQSYTMKDFKRKSMKDFEYLENEIDPPDWVIWATFILMALGTVGLAYYQSRSFGGYRGRRFRR